MHNSTRITAFQPLSSQVSGNNDGVEIAAKRASLFRLGACENRWIMC
jgi:hypothetical protein